MDKQMCTSKNSVFVTPAHDSRGGGGTRPWMDEGTRPWMDEGRTTQEQLSRTTQEQLSRMKQEARTEAGVHIFQLLMYSGPRRNDGFSKCPDTTHFQQAIRMAEGSADYVRNKIGRPVSPEPNGFRRIPATHHPPFLAGASLCIDCTFLPGSFRQYPAMARPSERS